MVLKAAPPLMVNEEQIADFVGAVKDCGGRSPFFVLILDGCTASGTASRENLKNALPRSGNKITRDIILGDYANYWCGQCIPRKYLRAAGNYFGIEGNLAIAAGKS